MQHVVPYPQVAVPSITEDHRRAAAVMDRRVIVMHLSRLA
jgi:hypothetical protein